jgi:hypothetical protein
MDHTARTSPPSRAVRGGTCPQGDQIHRERDLPPMACALPYDAGASSRRETPPRSSSGSRHHPTEPEATESQIRRSGPVFALSQAAATLGTVFLNSMSLGQPKLVDGPSLKSPLAYDCQPTIFMRFPLRAPPPTPGPTRAPATSYPSPACVAQSGATGGVTGRVTRNPTGRETAGGHVAAR